MSETVLTPTDVNPTDFGKNFTATLDGQVYAQPLAVSNVNITRGSSQGIHNVIYAATMHDSLYAIDANTGAILWQDNFNQIANPQVTTINSPVPTAGATTVPGTSTDNAFVNTADMGPELGIISTPTINSPANIIYVVTNSQELRNGSTPTATFTSGTTDIHYVQRLWAINISSGAVAITPTNIAAEPTSGGQVIGDTILDPTGTNTVPSFSSFTGYKYVAGPFIKGSGDNGTNDSAPRDGWVAYTGSAQTHPWTNTQTPMAAGYVVFNALLQMGRCATSLINGNIYLGYASHGDKGPYYGYLLGFSATTLANTAAFVPAANWEPFTTVSGNNGNSDAQAGLWGGGDSIVTDGTYLYFTTGNGAFNVDATNFSPGVYSTTDTGNSVDLPLDDDYGNCLMKLQIDSSSFNSDGTTTDQAGINAITGTRHNSGGSYNPNGFNNNGYGLKVVDYFAPSNALYMNFKDEDLGSGGVVLLPPTVTSTVPGHVGDPMLICGGKEGRIYLIDQDNLGGFNDTYPSPLDVSGNPVIGPDPSTFDRVLGEYSVNGIDVQTNQYYSTGAFYQNGSNPVFFVGLASKPDWEFNVDSFQAGQSPPNSASTNVPTIATSNTFGSRGTSTSISANGSSNAIVWTLKVSQSSSDDLLAYPLSLGSAIYDSNTGITGNTTRDLLTGGVTNATGVKFSVPSVYNGFVYAGTGGGSGTGGHILGTLVGYGLLNSYLTSNSSFFGTPTNLSATNTTSTNVHLTWTSHSTLATEFEIDRSTDGVNWSVIQYVPGAMTSYDDTITAGSTFYYRLRAINGANFTPFVTISPFSGNNNYYLRIDPSNSSSAQLFLSTTPTGTPEFTFSPSGGTALSLNSSSSADQLTVDFSNGSPIPSGGLSFTGTSSLMSVIGTSSNDSFGINASAVTLGSSSISYSSVSSITINGGAGNDTLTQSAQPAASVTFNGGTGSDKLIINAGAYTFTGNPQANTASLFVNDNSALIFTAAAPESGINVDNLASLSVGLSATTTLGTSAAVADRLVLVSGGLSLSSSARLDEGDNDLIIHNGADVSPSLFTLLQQGSNFSHGGYWNGSTGITSSAAAGNPPLAALGMELNSSSESSFDGITVSPTDGLIKYTYIGDTDLTGALNAADYINIDSGFGAQSPGWQNGDFNYDGVINGDDYTLIDNAFNTQQATVPAVIAAATEQIAPAPAKAAVFAATSLVASDETSSPFDRRRVHSIWSDLNL